MPLLGQEPLVDAALPTQCKLLSGPLFGFVCPDCQLRQLRAQGIKRWVIGRCYLRQLAAWVRHASFDRLIPSSRFPESLATSPLAGLNLVKLLKPGNQPPQPHGALLVNILGSQQES